MCCTARRSVSSYLPSILHTTLTLTWEEFCAVLNIPLPKYQDLSSLRRGFTSQVMFGYHSNHFGKHSTGPTSIEESRGQASRRALKWIDRLGLLPREGLDRGLAGVQGYPQGAHRQSIFGTADLYQSETLANGDRGMVSVCSSHQSLFGLSPATSGPTFPRGTRHRIGWEFEQLLHEDSRLTTSAYMASPPSTSPKGHQMHSKWSTRGPSTIAANTIPLKRRRLPEKLIPTNLEAAAPVLTKQGLLSRTSLHKEHIDRVAGKRSLFTSR